MTRLPADQLCELSSLISSRMGLNFPESRLADLERGIETASRELGFSDIEGFIGSIRSSRLDKTHIETLASHLTIGETYFFREKEGFDALEERILPELISSRAGSGKRLRVWSAGCSSGEEPYSIAILLNKLIPDIKDWNITILATDINPLFLRKASEGLYTEWSFRSAQPWIKDKYFRKNAAGLYEILPSIRNMVEFEYLNLADDVYPSLLSNTNAMDIIFCRNVLMYFCPERALRVLEGFNNSLLDSGWLLVSPTESLKPLGARFAMVNFPGTTFYRKKDGAEKTAVASPLPVWHAAQTDAPANQDEPEYAAAPFEPAAEAGDPPGKKDGQEPDAYAEAMSLFRAGLYAKAAESLSELLKTCNQARAFALQARINANLGRLEEALAWCQRAVEADILNPGHHYLLAVILQEQGRVEEATKALKKTLYLDDRFVLAHFVLGNIMLRLGEPGRSKKHLKNAFDLLSLYGPQEVLPESEGLTAGRLSEILASMSVERPA